MYLGYKELQCKVLNKDMCIYELQFIWHVWINNEKVDNKAAADWSLTEDKQEAKDFDKRFVTET